MTDARRHIGIVRFPDVEELDAIGPWEVLSYWSRNHPEDGYDVHCLSRAGGLVHCARAWRCRHTTPKPTPPRSTCWVYPGGQGARRQLTDEAQLDRVRRHRREVPLLTSVCTGVLVYAAAGVLAGRQRALAVRRGIQNDPAPPV